MNEKVGSIKEIMIDVPSGRISYAVLAVGGFLGIGERLFAIPGEALNLDEDKRCVILDVDKERLENALGFDKDNWPDMVDPSWADGVLSYWHVRGTISGTRESRYRRLGKRRTPPVRSGRRRFLRSQGWRRRAGSSCGDRFDRRGKFASSGTAR